jgi:hypothetical protein
MPPRTTQSRRWACQVIESSTHVLPEASRLVIEGVGTVSLSDLGLRATRKAPSVSGGCGVGHTVLGAAHECSPWPTALVLGVGHMGKCYS